MSYFLHQKCCNILIFSNKKNDIFAHMSTHIGKIIQEYVAENRISVTKIATLLNKNRSTIYDIFEREGIDSELLLEISYKLRHNFFQYYTTILEDREVIVSEKGEISEENKNEYVAQYKKLIEKLEAAEKEIAYLREINGLLKEKIEGDNKPES